jgi:hypothetical protein
MPQCSAETRHRFYRVWNMHPIWRTVLSRAMFYLMIALALALIAVEASWYFTPGIHERFWRDIVDRGDDSMAFRFFLQPVMAVVLGLYDGMRDVRLARSPDVSNHTPELPVDGLLSIARLVLLGLIMDLIYQIRVLSTFYPAEALLVTIPLVSIPYFAVRSIVRAIGARSVPK